MAIAWGTARGPARDQFDRTELDKRLIVMAGCYDSEKHRIIDEQPGDNGKRVLRVELTKGTVTKTPRFTTVKGPSDRWYVEDADFAAVTTLGVGDLFIDRMKRRRVERAAQPPAGAE